MSEAPVPPVDAALGNQIAGYAAYFTQQALAAYENGQPKPLIDQPKWQKPMDAIEDALKHPSEHSPGWNNIRLKDFHTQIEKWLQKNHITSLAPLAHGYNGWTANVFLAQVAGTNTSQVVRIGTEAGKMPHLDTPWNPILLQPHALSIMVHGAGSDMQRLALSRGSIAPMVDPGQPPGFNIFMNNYILAGTPYMVSENKDWSLLHDGTPISGDPADSLVFKSEALERTHAGDRWNPRAQQQIMRRIYENIERLQSELQKIYGKDYQLPEAMRFVVKTPRGFQTKQSLLLPDPLHPDHAPVIQRDAELQPHGRARNRRIFEEHGTAPAANLATTHKARSTPRGAAP